MTHRIICSGSGGQGMMFIGKLMAKLALDRYPHLTFFPSYGAEVRGGTSNCQIIISDEYIATPMVECADWQILMNQASVDRFLPTLDPRGTALVNSSLASAHGHTHAVEIPATQIAMDSGGIQAANVVMLAAMVKRSGLFERDLALAGVLEQSSKRGAKAVAASQAAFDKGWTL